MNNLKKIILLSLIPTFLTVFFVAKFTIPSVKQYFKLKEQIDSEKIVIKEIKSNIKVLKANKMLLDKLNRLKAELTGFDVEFPSELKDEILLIDLEMFANKTINKIFKVRSMPEVEVKITDPSKQKTENKNRSRRTVNKPEEVKPVTIMQKPLEINTVAYYNEIIDFVTFLEDYQRKVNIEGIYTNVFNEDKDMPNPRVELNIKGNIYKSTVNKKVKTPQKTNENQKTKKTTKV